MAAFPRIRARSSADMSSRIGMGKTEPSLSLPERAQLQNSSSPMKPLNGANAPSAIFSSSRYWSRSRVTIASAL